MKNNREKKNIIDNIFNNFSIDLTSRNFVFSNKLQNLLNQNKYFIRCITQGNRYFLYLTKFNNENYTLLIDSKLTDGYKYPKILIVNFGFDDSLYNNTLFSGELIKLKNNNWTFCIDDIHVYLNKNCKQCFKDRLKLLYQIFSKMYVYDPILTLFTIEINEYFNINDRNSIFQDYIPKLNYRIDGIQFVPNEEKLPIIDLYFIKNNYSLRATWRSSDNNNKSSNIDNNNNNKSSNIDNYNNNKSSNIDNNNKSSNIDNYNNNKSSNIDNNNNKSSNIYNYNNNKSSNIDNNNNNYKNIKVSNCKNNNYNNTNKKYLTLKKKKTTYQDVFNLHCYIEGTLKKHSIARIDSLECSEMVNKLLEKNSICEVECKYSQNFKKWIPVKKSESNICKFMDIDIYMKMSI